MDKPIHILWDSAHIWGLMAYRALKSLGLCCRLTKAREIAAGLLQGSTRFAKAKLIIVPGGNAKLKAKALTLQGLKAIQDFVSTGGTYLGICGGAGLALNQQEGLSLCPWPRQPYAERLQHLASGHVMARLAKHPLCQNMPNELISLPVWWPGRFAPNQNPNVEVLAYAEHSASDFWLGDLPLASIPKHMFSIWQQEYGVDLSSNFLKNTPLVITGTFGGGRYVLTYSHLETPQSAHANSFLTYLLEQFLQQTIRPNTIAAWNIEPESVQCKEPTFGPLYECFYKTQALLELGLKHQLFFRRTPWLFGWRRGLPGAQLNCLYTSLWCLFQMLNLQKVNAYWAEQKENFIEALTLFGPSAEENLLTTRIANVLDQAHPQVINQQDLQERRYKIFGSPLSGGGLLAKLLHIIEEMIFLSQECNK